MIMFFFGATLGTIGIMFGLIMLIAAILQMVIAFGGEMKKSFAPRGVKEAMEILDEIKQTIGGSGFDLVRERIEKYLVSHAKEYEESMKKATPRQFVYSAIANIAGDLVESGEYHLYRAILNPMGPGKDLLKLFDGAVDELVKMGVMEKANAEKEKLGVRENIKNAG